MSAVVLQSGVGGKRGAEPEQKPPHSGRRGPACPLSIGAFSIEGREKNAGKRVRRIDTIMAHF